MSSIPCKEASLPIDARIEDLLKRMTLGEKPAQLGGLWSRPMPAADGIDHDRARELLKHNG